MAGSTWKSRVLFILAALLPLTACGADAGKTNVPEEKVKESETSAQWFGGYLDVTLVPRLALNDVTVDGQATAILSFVTSHPERPCEPSWGGSYDLDQANSKLDLESQVESFRSAGNDVAVAFGGQRGVELAVACTDGDALRSAYAAVIDRYGLDTVDFDVEGAGAADASAAGRRAAAIAEIQAGRPADRPLKVWLTLPVSAAGLTAAAEVSVETMLKAGVDLAGVNIMTMNFGPLHEGQTMLSTSMHAAEGTHQTLKGLFQRSGKPLDDSTLWQKMGLTPMIGRNDVPDQVFSRDDAEGLSSFAAERGLGRMSMWSLNRDKPCHADDPAQSANAASGNCSGQDQEPGMFARVLGQPFAGTPSAEPGK